MDPRGSFMTCASGHGVSQGTCDSVGRRQSPVNTGGLASARGTGYAYSFCALPPPSEHVDGHGSLEPFAPREQPAQLLSSYSTDSGLASHSW